MWKRRQFLIGATVLAASKVLAARSVFAQQRQRTRLILLGTKGGPTLSRATNRSSPATLIVIKDIPYLIDCGYGVLRQLLSAGIELKRLRYIFITHYHSDHNLDYGALIYNTWVSNNKIDSYGPTGLNKLTRDFFEYEKFDIETRLVDEGGTDPRKLVTVHEFDKPSLVMQNADVKVTSCRVRHPPITQSYAYRFDANDRSIVISGDTTYAPELADFARGADLLVHEVMYLPAINRLVQQEPGKKRLRDHLLASHTSTEDVGRVAAQAGVKTVVLTHFVPGDDPSITDEQWSEGVRKYFKGRIIVGKDLIEI